MFVSEKRIAANRRNAQLAGRPKGTYASHTLATQEAKRKWVEMFHERVVPIFEALYKKAVDGDVMAAKELIDRAWGKATQGVEVTGEGGAPIVFMPLELIQKHALTVIDVTPQDTEIVNENKELKG